MHVGEKSRVIVAAMGPPTAAGTSWNTVRAHSGLDEVCVPHQLSCQSFDQCYKEFECCSSDPRSIELTTSVKTDEGVMALVHRDDGLL